MENASVSTNRMQQKMSIYSGIDDPMQRRRAVS
jgi:hypothetical protein